MANLMSNIYRCIYCRSKLSFEEGRLVCSNCSSDFEIRKGIPILIEKERYWCNFPRAFMLELNRDAEKTYWRDVVKKHISGNVAEHISAENRIDFRYILPDLKDKNVLDIGSMWGGITIPISRYCREIFAIDSTFETVCLLDIRRRQDNLHNINIALSSAYRLPFANNHFDVVLLIGVLEWLGTDYDFVVSEHYGKKRKLPSNNKMSPRTLQIQALEEIYRVLKPGGVVLIAIENRFFYKYFFGWPDAHTAVPFSSLLPRSIANTYMRFLKGQDYREYTYSYVEHKRILKKLGFDSVIFYAAMPSYRELAAIVPIDDGRYLKFYYEYYGLKGSRGPKRLIPQFILKLNLMKHFVSSFLILAEK